MSRRKENPCLCPSCGRPYEGRPDPYKLVDFLPISGVRRAVLRTLMANFGREVPTPVIVDRVYSGVEDGGPATAIEGVKVHTYELRKILEPYGITIRAQRGSSYVSSSHRIDWIDAPALQENAA